MNRRGFISLLAGAAGAPFVPWRGLVARSIILPPAFYLAEISGMQIRELAVPDDWIVGPVSVNRDSAHIRSDRLAVLVDAYAKRIDYVNPRLGRPIRTELRYRGIPILFDSDLGPDEWHLVPA